MLAWARRMAICLGRGADLHMAKLMSLPLTLSCSSKSRLVLPSWFTFLVPAHPGRPGQSPGAVNGCSSNSITAADCIHEMLREKIEVFQNKKLRMFLVYWENLIKRFHHYQSITPSQRQEFREITTTNRQVYMHRTTNTQQQAPGVCTGHSCCWRGTPEGVIIQPDWHISSKLIYTAQIMHYVPDTV